MKALELTEFISRLKKEGHKGHKVYLVKHNGCVASIHIQVKDAQDKAEKISQNAVVQEFDISGLLLNQ